MKQSGSYLKFRKSVEPMTCFFFFLLSFKNNFIYLFFIVLGLSCCKGFFSNCCKYGLLPSCSVQASPGSAFSCLRAWPLGARASEVAALRL